MNQQQQYKKFLKTTPLESFKSDDFIYYAGGSGVSINHSVSKHKKMHKKSTKSKQHKVHHYQRNSHKNVTINKTRLSESTANISDLPSPIPYLPPLNKKKRQHSKNKDHLLDNNENNLINNVKKSTLTDSDYKTQSSSTTDIASSSNDYRLMNQQQKINNDFENDVSVC